MTKKSLFSLLILVFLYCVIQLSLKPYLLFHPTLSQFVSFLYLWTPGVIALYFAHKEGISLPIFKKPRASFYLIPVYTALITGIAFLIASPFGLASTLNPLFLDKSVGTVFGYILLFLLTGYFLITLIFTFVLLGGELYWRGYLWEKWKGMGPLKAMGWIALVWSLWHLPITFFAPNPSLRMLFANLGFITLFNFLLTPILTYFRVKEGFILSASLFYSSLAGFIGFFLLLYPAINLRSLGIYGAAIFVLLLVFSLVFKLYSSKTWEQLHDKTPRS